MNHKRKRPKNARGGCLMCKGHKINGATKHCPWDFSRGFGKLRAEFHAANDLKSG